MGENLSFIKFHTFTKTLKLQKTMKLYIGKN